MKLLAVLFDMDGLILDTEPIYRRACRAAIAEQGLGLTDEQYTRLCGVGSVEARRRLCEVLGPGFDWDAYHASYRGTHHDRCFAESPVPVKPGVVKLLDWLDARQIPRAVATSTRQAKATQRLADAGLLGRFARVTGGDEVTHGKPAPDLFLLAADRLGVAPSGCVVLEDSEPGVEAAHAAGMRVLMVPDLKQPDAPTLARATAVCASLHDAIAALATMT